MTVKRSRVEILVWKNAEGATRKERLNSDAGRAGKWASGRAVLLVCEGYCCNHSTIIFPNTTT